MLNAVFVGWARFTQRRRACRLAGEDVAFMRKERVCRDWLVKWRYSAHISGALAHGLRSYFLRSTFSVFDAWARWAAEEVADRRCSVGLRYALEAYGEGAEDALEYSGRRWRRFEEASAFDHWRTVAHFAATATLFTGLAVRHSSSCLLRWAYQEFAFAVRLQVEERAAGLFWEHGRLQFTFGMWKEQSHLARLMRSKAASAVFHFVGRLQQLIFLRWKDVARGWRNRRLGHLAAKLRFEGTLVHRLFYAWQHYAKYVSWRLRQTQQGLIRYWLSIERSVFAAWKECVELVRGLRGIAEQKYVAATLSGVRGAFVEWSEMAKYEALMWSLVANYGLGYTAKLAFFEWLDFSYLCSLMDAWSDKSDGHRNTEAKRRALRVWRGLAEEHFHLEAKVEEGGEKRALARYERALELWSKWHAMESRHRENMDDALLTYGERTQSWGFGVWAKHASAVRETRRLALSASHIWVDKMYGGTFYVWKRQWQERVEHLRKMRRCMAFYSNSILMRIINGWRVCIGNERRRQEIAQKCVRRLLNRRLAMVWQAMVNFLEGRRALKRAVAERAFQTDKGRLSAAMSDWRGVCEMFHKYHGIQRTAVGYRRR